VVLLWDPEGRTTCESCIRHALAQNVFRCCPLTQQEGVSPDDLLPNNALRKAANQFVKEVMQKIQEIDEQANVKESIVPEGDSLPKVLEGGSAADQKRRDEKEEDPFGSGGDDDFGGDIFEVEADEPDSKFAKANDRTAKAKVETTELSIQDLQLAVGSMTGGPDNPFHNINNNPKPQPVSRASQNRRDRCDNNNDQTRTRRAPPAGCTMGTARGAVYGRKNSKHNERPQGHSHDNNNMDHRRETPYVDRSYRGGGSGGYHAGERGGYCGPPHYSSTPRGGSFSPHCSPLNNVSLES